MAIHNRFAVLEAAAEAGDATARDGLELIATTLSAAFAASEGTPWHSLNASDGCERAAEALAVWLEESAPDLFRLAEARTAWPDLIRDAIAACELVGATNGAAIAAEHAESFERVHREAVALMDSTQLALARSAGWLAENGEPKPESPAFARLLYDGSASLAELRAIGGFDSVIGAAPYLLEVATESGNE